MKTAQEYLNLRENHTLDCRTCRDVRDAIDATGPPCALGQSLTALHLSALIIDHAQAVAHTIESLSTLARR